MSDFFISELLVLLLLVPFVLRIFSQSLQSLRGTLFLPAIAFCICLLIIAGNGFPVSFIPVFLFSCIALAVGFPRMVRTLRGLETDWYAISSRIMYGILVPLFFVVVFGAFYFAPESGYPAGGNVKRTVTIERPGVAVLASRYAWAPSDEGETYGSVVFLGDASGGAQSRTTLAYILAEQGYSVFSDDYRSFYTWKNGLMSWPAFRFAAIRAGDALRGQPLFTDEEEIRTVERRNIARAMYAVLEKKRDGPLFIIAEGSACVPAAEYLSASGTPVDGFLCLVSPENVSAVERKLDATGYEGQYTTVTSETSMIPSASAYLPVFVLSGGEGTMIGRGELDCDDILTAVLLGGSRDTGRKRAERLSRRIEHWFALRRENSGGRAEMTTKDLDLWFDALLEPDRYEAADPSKNGLQVDNNGADITKIAFAVDACLETIERARAAGAGMLVVHHGLFWKECERVTGPHYRRMKALMDGNIALYASHLPLDAHAEVGNNAGIAERIGLCEQELFGLWRGVAIGVSGSFEQPVSLDTLVTRLFPDDAAPPVILPFGPREITTAAIVSGSGSREMYQAIDSGLDCFITGEIGHEEYHHARENGITVIAGGHYRTETFGPRLLASRLGRETGMEVVFIDVPTNL